LELVHAGHSKTGEVAITTLDFPDNETTTFWVGTEEGNVYQANRYDRAGAKAGLNQHDVYKAHSGPVMGLHFHPLVGPVDFSDLFLTCSVDWTVKLWRAKSLAKHSTSVQTITPVYSFEEADDYVYDVKWHPQHPALFGTVDGSGKFDLWNLNTDTEVSKLVIVLKNLLLISLSGTRRLNERGLWARDQQTAVGPQRWTARGDGRERWASVRVRYRGHGYSEGVGMGGSAKGYFGPGTEYWDRGGWRRGRHADNSRSVTVDRMCCSGGCGFDRARSTT
jgi:hypothetical protein